MSTGVHTEIYIYNDNTYNTIYISKDKYSEINRKMCSQSNEEDKLIIKTIR